MLKYDASSIIFKYWSPGCALVTNLATRWCSFHLVQIWPPGGATCIDYKFSHQVAPLVSVANWVTKWHHLHRFDIWSSLALVPKLTTRLRHLHCPRDSRAPDSRATDDWGPGPNCGGAKDIANRPEGSPAISGAPRLQFIMNKRRLLNTHQKFYFLTVFFNE